MSELKEVFAAYKKLSFTDRIVFYTTLSNTVNVHEDNLQDFLIETRIADGNTCIYCEGSHVVKNGKRRDGTQRFLCRDCHKSFLPTSVSITSRTRKRLSVWMAYARCLLDQKTLHESSAECGISVATAFSWRHKILDALHEMTDKVYLDGVVEADETFFNVSYKGNHKRFSMPRPPHKRGGDVHTSGLSSEKVCVPCAVSDTGISYARPGKLGKVSSDCISRVFDGIISPQATLCTDNEKAYRRFSAYSKISLIQMETDGRTTYRDGKKYGIQRINAYHSRLKGFMRRFHGVSTKYLGNYLAWNDLLMSNRRKREELVCLLMVHIMTVRMTVRNRDIPIRPPIPIFTRTRTCCWSKNTR